MSCIEPHSNYFRWVMLVGVSLLYCCFAMVHYSTAALASTMIEDLNLSLSQMGNIMGAWPMVYIFLSIPAGLLLDRFGIRHMLLLGIAAVALSAFMRASATNYAEMFIAVLIFGLGAPFISIGAPKLIREWFSYEQRGLALGICISITALGQIMGLILTHELLSVFDGNWRSTLNVYTTVCVISAALWILIISHPLCRSNAIGKSDESMREICMACIQLLRMPTIQAVLALGVGMFFYMHATINWLPKIIADTGLGLSEANSAYWASLPIITGMISAAIVPRFTSKNREIIILALLFFIGCTSCLLLSNSASLLILIAALVMIGIVRGSIPPVSVFLLMHLPGVTQKNIGAATGLFFAFGQIGGAMGPISFGYLAEKSTGFELPLYFLSGVCVLLALMSLSMRRAQKLNVE
ncbi:MAG: MFS transporter [Gammaproteobacteria bacterium]|jgi:MFS transporter, CP family, cyanate transporter|nr:MFS transporter [Gammaproteobacteria bacterium]